MVFLSAVLRRIQLFCLGFALSGLCVVLAGMLSAYPPNAGEDWQAANTGSFVVAAAD